MKNREKHTVYCDAKKCPNHEDAPDPMFVGDGVCRCREDILMVNGECQWLRSARMIKEAKTLDQRQSKLNSREWSTKAKALYELSGKGKKDKYEVRDITPEEMDDL